MVSFLGPLFGSRRKSFRSRFGDRISVLGITVLLVTAIRSQAERLFEFPAAHWPFFLALFLVALAALASLAGRFWPPWPLWLAASDRSGKPISPLWPLWLAALAALAGRSGRPGRSG